MTVAAQAPRPTLLHSVQALRGVAALLVVLFHISVFQVATPDGTRELLPAAPGLSLGWVGVDVFFVISGFVMVYIGWSLPSGARQSLKFLRRRALRIYPLWWAFAGLAAVEFLLTGGRGLAYLVNSLLLVPQATSPVLEVGWTLIHEMYFYALFALALLLPVRQRLAALLGWTALLLGANLVTPMPGAAEGWLSLALSPLGLEFGMGAAVGLLVLGGFHREARAATWLGALLFVGALLFPPAVMDTYPTLGRILLFAAPTALLLYGVVGLERTGRLHTPGPLRALGDWSYSLYLCHLFVLSAGGRVVTLLAEQLPEPLAQHFRFGPEPGALDTAFLISGTLASVIVAALAYRWLEQPLLALTRRRKPAPDPNAALLARMRAVT